MIMKLTKQEAQIKKMMSRLEGSVDHDALWRSLEDHVPAKKRKRSVLILWFLLPVILGTSGLFIYRHTNSLSHKLPFKTEVQKTDASPYADHSGNHSEKIIQNPDAGKSGYRETTQMDHQKDPMIPDGQSIIYNHNMPSTIAIGGKSKVEATLQSSTRSIENIPMDTPMRWKGELSNPEKKNFSVHTKTDRIMGNDLFVFQKPGQEKTMPLIWSPQLVLGTGRFSFSSQNPEDEGMVDYLNAISSVKPVLGLDVLVQYPVHPRLSLQSGMMLRRLTIAHTPDWQKTETESIINLSGISQNISKRLSYMAIGHLYHSTVDIPLGISYQYYSRGTWSTELYAGLNIHLLTHTHGYHIGDDLKLSYIENPDIQWFPKGVMPGWALGMTINRKITPGCTFSLSTKIQHMEVHYGLSHRDILEKYSLFEITLGLKHSL
jgi:hypothetical protein